MARHRAEPDLMFDDQASLAVSLESIEHERLHPNQSTLSAFRAEESEPESERSSAPWSPPAWRKGASGWQQRHHFHHSSISRSRSTSPLYESAGEGDETILPASVPLPASPMKQSPRNSVEPHQDVHPYDPDFAPAFGGGQPTQQRRKSVSAAPSEPPNNYIRFAVRAEVQHRTEPIDTALSWVRDVVDRIAKSPSSIIGSLCMVLFAFVVLKTLVRPPLPLPAPDILKATQVARTFEPLIYYSEGGMRQVSEIQETGIAVWDLGESVRSSNMTSAPIITKELDSLSASLNTLAEQLTRFFVHVDGDIDGILIVMEWSKRRLLTIEPVPSASLTSAVDNIQSLLTRVGILQSSDGSPTIIGHVVREIFGLTPSQRNAATLQRTFNEFLSVLEESIANELDHSLHLMALFGTIEKQFLTLQRTVSRESDQQDREEGEMLSSLWTRVIGSNAAQLRKFEKNRQLLATLRQRTVQNKHLIVDHNGKLMQLKSNLEMLRKRLASPLVRRNDSSVLSVEEQLQGLDDTYLHLKTVRERQKQRTLDMLYNSGNRGSRIVKDSDKYEIEGGR